MTGVIKVYIYDGDDKFFGEGPLKLLKGVEKTNSLRAAANELGMAYSKAFKLIKTAEEHLGFALTQKHIGGTHGGGSTLTPKAQEFILKYEQYKESCKLACTDIFNKVFCEHE
jgi:molybdate transport system regulatory protein